MLALLVLVLVADPKPTESAAAVESLRTALASDADFSGKDFVKVPLTKADAATARELLWKAHAARMAKDRTAEIEALKLTDGDKAMPIFLKTFGDEPKAGRSLWISMHGGGNGPARMNDSQWENQKRLYTLDEGVYAVPRAPTNTWNLWHEPHIDRLFTRLIEDLIVLKNVNPDRVYILGYSAGGDGVYALAPRMADSLAAAAMMAGHPNGVSVLSLRNLPFALQVGGKDAAYNRNKVTAEYGEKLDQLRKADPAGYEHFLKVHEDKPHWMGGQDKVALPWMAKFTRNPIPDRVVWKQTGTPHDRFYWLAVPDGMAKLNTLVDAKRSEQTIEITAAEDVAKLLVRLDDRMVDLDKPVTVKSQGKTLFEGTAPRTIATLAKTLAGRGDPKMIFDAEVAVELK
ncbi:MAG: hypothetical protein U0746_19080 [Gemmataceae bacterium]